jgi:hypothetical protein
MRSSIHLWSGQPAQLAIPLACAACLLACAELPTGARPSQASTLQLARQPPPATQPSALPLQTPALPFPVLPVIAEYEYTPHYFMQWLDDHPQYARIEAAVTDSQPPVYNLVLTERGSGRRVNYCNSEAKVKGLAGAGQAARLTAIEYRATNKFGQPPIHAFSFTDERGQAVRWRFTLAAPASERGAGLTPQEGGAGWLFVYRDLGSAAGEGTAAQIGDKVSEAAAWAEISAPPYFVAYRGVYAEGMGIGIFPAGQERWRVTASPKEMSEGAQWTLTDGRGRTRHWRVAARRGDELTINEVSPSGSARSLQARQTANGLALRSMMIASGPKTLRLSFTPEMDLSAAAISSAFQVDQNGHNKIAHGSVSGERKGGALHVRYQPKAPDWAKARALTATVTINAAGYQIETR